MRGDSRNKYLLKNTIIFAIGNLGTKFISFFLVPLYTNVLLTSEYGIVDLISTVSTVAIPLLTLNIAESVMRFALDKDADNDRILSVGYVVFAGATALGVLLIPISSLFNTISTYGIYVYFYALSLAYSQLFLCDLRGKEKLLQYSIGNIIHTMMIAVFNIVFLVCFHWGIKGYLSAYILANIVTAIYAFFIGKAYSTFRNFKIDKDLFLGMTKYSVVLIPNSFMWWIMNSSDRLMVSAIVGVAANGVYAISYKLPTLVSTSMQIFNQAWGYSAIKEKGAADENEYNNQVFRMLISFAMLSGIGLLIVSKPFLRIYVNPAYYEAWKYTPFLIVGCVYLTIATFMATSYTVHKDSFGYLFSGMFGALLNILLNFVTIPAIGIYGAAISTMISYMTVFVFRLFHTRKYIKYNIFIKEFFFGSILLLLSSVVMYMESNFTYILQLLILIITMYLYKAIWLVLLKKMINKVIRKR